MNINNLQVQLQTAVENAATEASTDNTSATLYYLQLAKAVQALNMGQIRTIDQTSNLPSAAASEGWLYFVQDIERLYFSNGTAWDSIAPFLYNNTAWAWGCGSCGRLGDNTTANKSSPVSVVGGFCDWSQLSAGYRHSLGLRTNGTAWSWGENTYGRLGDNTTVSKSSPVSVVGGFTNWCQMSAGSASSFGLRQTGALWAWGLGVGGQLGDNTVVSKSSPVLVIGIFDWCKVSAGGSNLQGWSLGIRQNGTAWGWGYNSCGNLGDNTVTNRSSPVSVVGGFTDWCQISAGCYHSLAVRTGGTAWAWGQGTSGRLGDNTATTKSSPVSVVGGFTDWCQVAAGAQHSLAVRQNGTAWSWGENSFGKLGNGADGAGTSRSSPGSVVGGFTDWCQISAGKQHSVAIRQNGTVWAWGQNVRGQLGDDTATSRSSPVSVVGGYTDWSSISAGSYQTLAIRSTQV